LVAKKIPSRVKGAGREGKEREERKREEGERK